MRAPVAEHDSQLVIVARRKGIRAGGYLWSWRLTITLHIKQKRPTRALE